MDVPTVTGIMLNIDKIHGKPDLEPMK
jgi:hypothetical protein